MRYFLALIFVCAVGAPTAFATPMADRLSVSASQTDAIMQVSKRKPPARRQSRNDGGIHPLVGSGDY